MQTTATGRKIPGTNLRAAKDAPSATWTIYDMDGKRIGTVYGSFARYVGHHYRLDGAVSPVRDREKYYSLADAANALVAYYA